MRGVAASSKTYLKNIKGSFKRKQRCVYCPRDISKPTSLIHGYFQSSERCKVLNIFGMRYTSSRPCKKLRQEPTADKITRKISR